MTANDKNTTRKIRAAIRRGAFATGSTCPIFIEPGDNPPEFRGEGFRWETRGGQPVKYPKAYAKKGWSNLVYKNSTRRISVGETWLLHNLPDYRIHAAWLKIN